MELNTINKTGTWSEAVDRLNNNFSKTSTEVEKVKQNAIRNKGLFPTLDSLKAAVPSPVVGDWAVVGDTIPGPIYQCTKRGVWSETGTTGGGGSVDLSGILTAEEIDDVTSILQCIMRINYQSDFKIIEKNLNGDVNTPFRFTYFNPFKGKFIASFDGQEYVGCSRMEDGSLLVAFDNPGFSPGMLKVKREYFISDSDFMDGICNLVSIEDTGIVLTPGKTDESTAEIMPYPDYAAYNAVQSVSLSDKEYDDVLSDFNS